MKPRYVALALVAVGLGVGLYGLSIPVRANAQRAHCQSNLKRIGLAALQYVRDYDEKFVMASKWKEDLRPYAHYSRNDQFSYSCPVTKRDYAFNAKLGGVVITLVNRPNKMAMFYEPARAVNADGGQGWSSSGIHDGGSHVCFHDGHVELLKTKPSFWAPELAVRRSQGKDDLKGKSPIDRKAGLPLEREP